MVYCEHKAHFLLLRLMYIVRCFYLPLHISKLIYDTFINNYIVVETYIDMCVHAVILPVYMRRCSFMFMQTRRRLWVSYIFLNIDHWDRCLPEPVTDICCLNWGQAWHSNTSFYVSLVTVVKGLGHATCYGSDGIQSLFLMLGQEFLLAMSHLFVFKGSGQQVKH